MNSARRHIWVLSELYFPEASATGHNITKIAEGLATEFDVRVLCAQPTYAARGTKAPPDEIRNNVHIHRCAATTLNKDVLPFRILNILTISASVFFNSLGRIRRGDIVLVVTNPPTLPLLVFLACTLRGAHMILRIEDVYPEALVATGILGTDSLAVKVLNALHARLYRKVDRVTVLGRDMGRLVHSKIGGASGHVSLITNFADSDEIRPTARERNPLLARLGLTDKFVIQYSGNMGRTHGMEGLLASARELQKHPEIQFLFIGSGAKAPWVRRTVEETGLKNVTVLPPQPRAELSDTLNACDIAVISFVPGMAGVSVPCRIYNILSAGKPLIAVADHDSELANVVEEEGVGWVVPPDQPELLAKAILEARRDSSLLLRMASKARAAVENRYTLPYVVDKYRALVAALLQEIE